MYILSKKELTPEAFADEEAAKWKAGLESWGQDGARIAKLREAADFLVYTPGSTAGLPVSILQSFSVPAAKILKDAELLGERWYSKSAIPHQTLSAQFTT